MSSALQARQASERQREDTILETAAALLVEQGFDGLTYESLARRAHVGKATLYARWPGKAALVVDTLRLEHERRAVPVVDGGSLRADLMAMAARMLDDRERSALLLLALATAVQSDPVVADAVQEHLGGQFYLNARLILDAAIARGELAPEVYDLPFAVDLMPALVMFRLLLAPGQAIDAADVVDRVLLPVLTQSLPRA